MLTESINMDIIIYEGKGPFLVIWRDGPFLIRKPGQLRPDFVLFIIFHYFKV
jgi:hypothetical protein